MTKKKHLPRQKDNEPVRVPTAALHRPADNDDLSNTAGRPPNPYLPHGAMPQPMAKGPTGPNRPTLGPTGHVIGGIMPNVTMPNAPSGKRKPKGR